jgi:YVTN family beta-propeller protein
MHAAFAPLRLAAAPLVLALTLACSADRQDEVVDLPTRALLVAAGNAGHVAVLDADTLESVGTVSVADGLHPHHFGTDGTRVLVTATSEDLSQGHGGTAGGGGHMHGSGGHSIVYELGADGRLREVIEVDAIAHNAAFLSDGRTIVLAMAEHGMIQAYDADTFAQTWWTECGSSPLEVTPSDDAVIVANAGDASVSVIDVASHEVRATVEVETTPVGAWRSADGSLRVTTEGGGTVDRITLDPPAVASSIDIGGVPGQAFVTPDGAELWVTVEDRGVIARYDASTDEARGEIVAGTKPHALLFDGARALVTDEGGDALFAVDVASATIVDEVDVPGAPNGLALWTPPVGDG